MLLILEYISKSRYKPILKLHSRKIIFGTEIIRDNRFLSDMLTISSTKPVFSRRGMWVSVVINIMVELGYFFRNVCNRGVHWIILPIPTNLQTAIFLKSLSREWLMRSKNPISWVRIFNKNASGIPRYLSIAILRRIRKTMLFLGPPTSPLKIYRNSLLEI